MLVINLLICDNTDYYNVTNVIILIIVIIFSMIYVLNILLLILKTLNKNKI
jgi:hypothetical protein